jgi:hypothetical protein
MEKTVLPKSENGLREMPDADLEALRLKLTGDAETLRALRKLVAREAEFRAAKPELVKAAHAIKGAGGIESQEG